MCVCVCASRSRRRRRWFRQWWGVGERGPHTCARRAVCLPSLLLSGESVSDQDDDAHEMQLKHVLTDLTNVRPEGMREM